MKIENFEAARKLLLTIKDIELKIQNVRFHFQKEDHVYVDEDVLEEVCFIMTKHLECKKVKYQREFEAL